MVLFLKNVMKTQSFALTFGVNLSHTFELVIHFHHITKREIQLYLIDERCKAIVQRFDLVFLLRAHHLDVGVDLQVEGRQQALVDRDADHRWPQVRGAGAEALAGCAQRDPA